MLIQGFSKTIIVIFCGGRRHCQPTLWWKLSPIFLKKPPSPLLPFGKFTDPPWSPCMPTPFPRHPVENPGSKGGSSDLGVGGSESQQISWAGTTSSSYLWSIHVFTLWLLGSPYYKDGSWKQNFALPLDIFSEGSLWEDNTHPYNKGHFIFLGQAAP